MHCVWSPQAFVLQNQRREQPTKIESIRLGMVRKLEILWIWGKSPSSVCYWTKDWNAAPSVPHPSLRRLHFLDQVLNFKVIQWRRSLGQFNDRHMAWLHLQIFELVHSKDLYQHTNLVPIELKGDKVLSVWRRVSLRRLDSSIPPYRSCYRQEAEQKITDKTIWNR